MNMKSEIKINNIDVSAKLINWNISKDINNNMNVASITFSPSIRSLIDISNGDLITIKRGTLGTENFKFNGYIENINYQGTMIICNCKDKLFDLYRKEVTTSYDYTIDSSAGVVSEIFQDLVTTYGGLRANSNSITDSGTTLILKKFVCNHNKNIDKCKELAGALDWQFYYNSNDSLVYFQPRGEDVFTTDLVIGSNVAQLPKWSIDLTQCVNKLTIIGSPQEVETTEEFSGDASETEFTITYTPISVKVYVDSVLQVGGVESSTATYDYIVDKENKKIVFTTASTPGIGVNNVDVNYSYLAPVVVTGRNQSSIDSYGTYERTITKTDIKTMDDATEYMRGYLTKYSIPFYQTDLNLSYNLTDSIKVGDKVHIIDAQQVVDKYLIVLRINEKFPESYDTITVGDKEFKLENWLENVGFRIAELEKKFIDNQDILLQIEDISNNINYESRYVKYQNTDIDPTNTTLIIGHPTMSIIGTNLIGDTYTTLSTTDERIIQGDDIYKEHFYDTDFKDSTNTTATWNTTTKKAEFTQALKQIQTSTVYYNNVSINTVKLNISQGSGESIVTIDTSLPGISNVDIVEEI